MIGTLNLATCDVYPPKAVETLYTDNVMDIVFFNVCKIYFRLPGFIEALDSKGIINTLKISFTSAMECTQTLQLSLLPRDK